jgi:hypothetical protein
MGKTGFFFLKRASVFSVTPQSNLRRLLLQVRGRKVVELQTGVRCRADTCRNFKTQKSTHLTSKTQTHHNNMPGIQLQQNNYTNNHSTYQQSQKKHHQSISTTTNTKQKQNQPVNFKGNHTQQQTAKRLSQFR